MLEMGYYEVQRFINGYNRRYRPSWEQHRSLVHSIASMFCDKDKVPRDTHAFLPLPWDNEYSPAEDNRPDEAALQAMMDQMNAHNAMVDAQSKVATE